MKKKLNTSLLYEKYTNYTKKVQMDNFLSLVRTYKIQNASTREELE